MYFRCLYDVGWCQIKQREHKQLLLGIIFSVLFSRTVNVILSSQDIKETARRLRDSMLQTELTLAKSEARWGDYQGTDRRRKCRMQHNTWSII